MKKEKPPGLRDVRTQLKIKILVSQYRLELVPNKALATKCFSGKFSALRIEYLKAIRTIDRIMKIEQQTLPGNLLLWAATCALAQKSVGKLLIAVWTGTAERRVSALAERLFNITTNAKHSRTP